jgi:hypothetical protein
MRAYLTAGMLPLVLVVVLFAALLAGCGSNADTASDNISTECENFSEQCQRKIVGINGITDKILFEVEGRCSLEMGDSMADTLDVICKHGPGDIRKHYLGMSDNVTFLSTQVQGMDVDEYRTKIVLRPQALVPDLDLLAGEKP